MCQTKALLDYVSCLKIPVLVVSTNPTVPYLSLRCIPYIAIRYIGFDPRPVHVGIVVNKVAVGQVLVTELCLPCQQCSVLVHGSVAKLHNYRNLRASLWHKSLTVTRPVLEGHLTNRSA
jgi:hypothetical protein